MSARDAGPVAAIVPNAAPAENDVGWVRSLQPRPISRSTLHRPGGPARRVFRQRCHGRVGRRLVVVGRLPLGIEAFRWTAAGGMVGLGDLPGESASVATGVSADGSVVVGEAVQVGSRRSAGRRPAGWSAWATCPAGFWSDAMVCRPTAPSSSGGAVGDPAGNDVEAFRWTAAGGMVGLGDLPGGDQSSAAGVSADGSTVVGSSDHCRRDTRRSAGRRRRGMVGLGDLPGGDFYSIANGVSADGSTSSGGGQSPPAPGWPHQPGGSSPFPVPRDYVRMTGITATIEHIIT